jgi:hypothetical protein
MATETVNQTAQHGGDGDHRLTDAEADNLTVDVNNALALLNWITAARFVLDEVRAQARLDPDMADLLRLGDVPINHPEWTIETQNALEVLFLSIARQVNDLGSKRRA